MNEPNFTNYADQHILIIGFGSIGQRHASLFSQVGSKISVISRHAKQIDNKKLHFYSSLAELPSDALFDYIIIANETSAHIQTLESILNIFKNFKTPILIEKPLADSKSDLDVIRKYKLLNQNTPIYIGFNLRFLPVVLAAKNEIGINTQLIRAEFHSHSYLPHWRPQQDYRITSSANRSLGGGVLRDLSHELDLAHWFCGDLSNLSIFGGQLSSLELNVEDNVHIIGKSTQCPLISVSLSYSQHIETRALRLITNEKTIMADLMTGKLHVSTQLDTFEKVHICKDFNNTYRNMHADVLSEEHQTIANVKDGWHNVEVIDQLSQKIHLL